MSDYTWVTEPPIRAVSADAVEVCVKQFQAAIVAYGPIPGDPEARTDDNPEGKTDLSERMNRQISDAVTIAKIIDKSDWNNEALPIFEYTFAGEPLALMQLQTNGRTLEIKNLASHPGTMMAGGIMVEYALNRIEHFNATRQDKRLSEAMLVLYSMNPRSTAAWSALGFVPIEKNANLTGHINPLPMSLNANESSKWQKVDNKWRHAAYVTTATLYRKKGA